MTPKERAKELVDRFYKTTPNESWYVPASASTSIKYTRWRQARECALIAVEETIRTLHEDIRDLDVRGSVLLDLIEYWEAVKQEIKQELEKL